MTALWRQFPKQTLTYLLDNVNGTDTCCIVFQTDAVRTDEIALIVMINDRRARVSTKRGLKPYSNWR